MENLPTYRLTQSGPEAQGILNQVNLNTVDIEQLKRLYQALNQSEPEIIEPTDTWPVANPSDTVIYRVIDRENTPPEYYSDYMWNGTSMVPMAQYDNAIDNEPTANSNNLVKSGGVYGFVLALGGAYDISAAHAVGGVLATYDDLEDALGTNGANVPSGVRKGGMSVKFVLSSDNKYVQYMLSTNYWSTSVSDWKKINELELYTSGSLEFYINDGIRYAVLGVINGHIKTKNFDSSLMSLVISSMQEDIEDAKKISLINRGIGDLSIADINNYILALFENGHIKTKNFDSSSIECLNLSNVLNAQLNLPVKHDAIKILLRKSIKILFIGNSISQDHATYIPWLLSNIYNGEQEDKIDFTIGIFYIGSHRIDQYATEDWDTLKASIWSYANNTSIWTNSENQTTLNQALQAADWDIISIQGYFNTGVTDDVTKAVQFVSRLRQQVQNDFKLAYLIHQTYRGDTMFKTILEAAATVIQQNDVSVLFAPGIANEYAKQYFTTSQLTPDNTHNNEGLPCMVGAYECLSAILQELDSENVILGDTNILTLAVWQTLNIPGPNGTMNESLNTQENYQYIQECALLALAKANMLLKNLKTFNIYNYVKVNSN